MNTEEKITTIFTKVGEQYGYENVEASFSVFRDFNVRWQRSYKWADFKLSDYLNNAPESVIEDLAVVLFERISGSNDVDYSENFVKWITSEEFTKTKQPVYIRRRRGLSEGEKLNASRQRLIQAGLIPNDENVKILWKQGTSERKAGRVSVLMKVIEINAQWMDKEELSDHALDYAVYYYYCHILRGWGATPDMKALNELTSKFPGETEAMSELLHKGNVYL